MAIESAFRSAPLTLIGGTVYAVGNPATNPLRYAILEPSQGIEAQVEIDSGKEVDGDFQQRRATLTGKTYSGEVVLKADPENLYYLLLGMFGRDLQTTLHVQDAQHSPAAYSHTFLPGRTAPSFTVEEDLADGTNGRLTSGVIVSRLEFDFGKIVTVKAQLEGYRQIPNTYTNAGGVATQYGFGSVAGLLPAQMGGDGTKQVIATASPGYVDVAQGQSGDGPLVFAGLGTGTQAGFGAAYLLVNGTPVAVEILEGSRIVVEREIDSRMAAGSGFDRGAVTANKFLVTGQLVALYEDMTLPANMLQFSQLALDLLFTGAPIGTSGYSYSLEFHVPHLKLTKAPVGEAVDTIVINSDFVTRKDDVLGYTVKVIAQNSVNNVALAGQSVPTCVTTAIIPNNTTGTATVNTTAGLFVGQQVILAGATAATNPYTVESITDATHAVLQGAGGQALIQGNIPIGATLTPVSGPYGPGGLGGWQPV
jgi:hypothetical protein